MGAPRKDRDRRAGVYCKPSDLALHKLWIYFSHFSNAQSYVHRRLRDHICVGCGLLLSEVSFDFHFEHAVLRELGWYPAVVGGNEYEGRA
jgi:hypothetical protein